ncbi:MAG: alanine racemase, partial [Bacilli bacterium]|nr:alanine racemase [Bacilli bacterium]
EDAKYIYENSSEQVFLEGIFTHLSIGLGSVFNKQIENFKNITGDIDLSKVPIVHLDRSLTLEQHEKIDFANGVRLGLIMYGFNKRKYIPSKKRQIVNMLMGRKNTFVPSKLSLSMMTKLITNVIEIKKVNKGEVVGYAGMNNDNQEKMVAILPIGFADFAYISSGMEVSINGKRYKVAVVNMDVCMVEVDNDVKLWDSVEIFGDNISIREVSDKIGVNVYKILLSVTDRVPRVYKKKNDIYEMKYRRMP